METKQFPDNVPESVLLSIVRVLLPDMLADLAQQPLNAETDSAMTADATEALARKHPVTGFLSGCGVFGSYRNQSFRQMS